MSMITIPTRYHPVHVALHWLIFLLVVLMLGLGKIVLPDVPANDPQKAFILQTHTYIGGLIAALLVVRLILRFITKRPPPADAGNRFLNFLAKAVHFVLYLLLIGMAISGVGLFQQANLSAVFDGTAPYPQDFFQYLPRLGHGLLSTLLVLMILLHAGAALYHQFVRRDNLLARMWFGRR